jgi:hypothetical protein
LFPGIKLTVNPSLFAYCVLKSVWFGSVDCENTAIPLPDKPAPGSTSIENETSGPQVPVVVDFVTVTLEPPDTTLYVL